ncbi:hypothetical protein [Noviherbaspirillum pedocola]|uniref:Uncharacterized protein n=1 Tax=Noviherbaspirillum pedocola TaxID=2801341 RepID=A0A934W7U8_9BURK|nr:hypothetical protein [Noviherbaspirillum pedocola]MBK4736795.1 hypothetical protein [Noviherbaspirillum pedocola]
MSDVEFHHSVGMRTVLYLSPAVCTAALLAAQQSGLSLHEWMEHRISYVMADDEVAVERGLDALAPWSLACADLFARVANHAPEVLEGRWALLYERVRLEQSLWHQPTQSLDKDRDLLAEPYISKVRLRAAWPRLCAATFCL